jgi:hypothetical protein
LKLPIILKKFNHEEHKAHEGNQQVKWLGRLLSMGMVKEDGHWFLFVAFVSFVVDCSLQG